MEKLIVLGFVAIILFVLSIPLHELFHVLSIKCLGGRGKIRVTWLAFKCFGVRGSVEGEDGTFDFPKLDRWKKHFRLIGLFLGLAGGLGSAAVLSGIGVFLLLVPLISPPVWQSFLFIASLQLVIGVIEAIKLSKEIELIEDG